jgi:hypothetical protein
MARRLRTVEAMPEAQTAALLPGVRAEEDDG